MSAAEAAGPGFWRTLGILLQAARRRGQGRRERQIKIIQRNNAAAASWAGIGSFFVILLIIGIHCLAAAQVQFWVASGQRVETEERTGGLLVS